MSRVLRTLGWLLFVLGYVVGPAFAQVTGPPHVFVANTVASPDEVNLNFSTVYAAALNRSGGTMTGNLLFSADNTLDIGASGATRPRDFFLGRNAAIGGTLGVTGATTLAALSATTGTFSAALSGTTLALSNTGATSIDTAGGIQAGTGNVNIIGTDGRIPDISTTYFASLSGANLTGILETAITDGSLLARLAAAEVLTGQWRASNGLVVGTTGFPGSTGVATISLVSSAGFSPLNFYDAGGASDEKWTQLVQSAGQTIVRFVNDAGTLVFDPLTIDRTGYNASTITLNGALALPSVISPAALASGNNNNYNPTSLSSSAYVILTADAGGSNVTGLAAQAAGTEVTLCEPTPGAGSLTIAHESGSSTAANRFNNGAQANITLNKDTSGGVGGPCVTYWYHGSGARWLLKSTSTSVP